MCHAARSKRFIEVVKPVVRAGTDQDLTQRRGGAEGARDAGLMGVVAGVSVAKERTCSGDRVVGV